MKRYEKHINEIIKFFCRSSASCDLSRKTVINGRSCEDVSCFDCYKMLEQYLLEECEG